MNPNQSRYCSLQQIIKGLLILLMLALPTPRIAAEDDANTFIEWPDTTTFTKGKTTTFRLPFFEKLFTYPNDKPLYNVLYLPKDYDPTQAYPLCVRFQIQGFEPATHDFVELSDEKAIVLGVSMVMTKPIERDKIVTLSSETYHIAATVQWVMAKFNIDRTRVFVGGFSAGGWNASAIGMSVPFQHISTHFVILSAGLRGNYRAELFKGREAIVGAGTKDLFYQDTKIAGNSLRTRGLGVTYFEIPSLKDEDTIWRNSTLKEWWTKFSTEKNAENWLLEADGLEKKNPAEALQKWVRVAALGENNPSGKAALARLEKLEGKALPAYQQAVQFLRSRKYELARKAFTDAGKLASQNRSPRIIELCTLGLQDVEEWRFCEHLMAMEEAQLSGRFLEACIISQEGTTRFKTTLPTWASIFNMRLTEGKWTPNAETLSRENLPRAKAQQLLAKAFLQILSGEGEKIRADLEKLAKDQAALPEGKAANRLLKRLDE
jgi:hypothetical protein